MLKCGQDKCAAFIVWCTKKWNAIILELILTTLMCDQKQI